jgi:hypothetical protein
MDDLKPAPAHIEAINQICRHIRATFEDCEIQYVTQHVIRVSLERGYSLSIICPVNLMGNRDYELEASRLSVAPMVETSLFLNNNFIKNEDFEYDDVRRWFTNRPQDIIEEIIRLRNLIEAEASGP